MHGVQHADQLTLAAMQYVVQTMDRRFERPDQLRLAFKTRRHFGERLDFCHVIEESVANCTSALAAATTSSPTKATAVGPSSCGRSSFSFSAPIALPNSVFLTIVYSAELLRSATRSVRNSPTVRP